MNRFWSAAACRRLSLWLFREALFPERLLKHPEGKQTTTNQII